MNELTVEQKQHAMTPAGLLAIAVQQGADIDRLEKLMELQERWEKNEARKAYVAAMNAFKANPPELFKNRHVKYNNTEYDHASLDHVTNTIASALSAHGLSHRWDVQQLEGGVIRVTCVITHVLGHSESTPLQSGADPSGGKNSIQAIGSAVTYLQRYTLLAATGLATKEMDNDGKTTAETISDSQAADLVSLMEEVGANREKFLAFLKIDAIENLPASEYPRAVKVLEAKRKKS